MQAGQPAIALSEIASFAAPYAPPDEAMAASLLATAGRSEAAEARVDARATRLVQAGGIEVSFAGYDTASLTAFTGRALIIFRAGFALNIVGSFVNGLMPLRSFVAGFLITTNFANPGITKRPDFLSSV
jgi:hypothetical protein